MLPSSYEIMAFNKRCEKWLEDHIDGNKLGTTKKGGIIVRHEYIEKELLDRLEGKGFEEGEDFEIVPMW